MLARRAPGRSLPIVPEGHIRIGGPLAIPEVLLHLGVEPGEVLASAGLDASIFSDPDTPLPCTALGRLLSACVARTNCRHFGLLVGAEGGPSSLGLVGLLIHGAADVGTALRQTVLYLYLHLHDRGAVAVLSSQGDVAQLTYAIYAPDMESSDQIGEGAIAIAYNIIRSLCGAAWAPTAVLLASHCPADVRPYRRFYRAPVRFDAPHNALALPMKWLAQPLPVTDPSLHLQLQDEVRYLDAIHRMSFAAKMRRTLRAASATARQWPGRAGPDPTSRDTRSRRRSEPEVDTQHAATERNVL